MVLEDWRGNRRGYERWRARCGGGTRRLVFVRCQFGPIDEGGTLGVFRRYGTVENLTGLEDRNIVRLTGAPELAIEFACRVG